MFVETRDRYFSTFCNAGGIKFATVYMYPKSLSRHSAWRPDRRHPDWVSLGTRPSLRANTEVLPQLSPLPPPATSFPLNYSLILHRCCAVQRVLQAELLKTSHINKVWIGTTGVQDIYTSCPFPVSFSALTLRGGGGGGVGGSLIIDCVRGGVGLC
jgi:hypothetical protein